MVPSSLQGTGPIVVTAWCLLHCSRFSSQPCGPQYVLCVNWMTTLSGLARVRSDLTLCRNREKRVCPYGRFVRPPQFSFEI